MLNMCHWKDHLRNCDYRLKWPSDTRIQLDIILISEVIVSLPNKENMKGNGIPSSSKVF